MKTNNKHLPINTILFNNSDNKKEMDRLFSLLANLSTFETANKIKKELRGAYARHLRDPIECSIWAYIEKRYVDANIFFKDHQQALTALLSIFTMVESNIEAYENGSMPQDRQAITIRMEKVGGHRGGSVAFVGFVQTDNLNMKPKRSRTFKTQ